MGQAVCDIDVNDVKAKQTMICNAVRYVSFQVPGRQRVYKRAVQQRTVTSADGQVTVNGSPHIARKKEPASTSGDIVVKSVL